MTTDDVVVDVSLDWVLACDVQQRFMQGLGRTSYSMDYSAHCRQVRALGGDCYEFMPLANERLALVVGDASCGPQKMGSISRGDLLQPIFVVQSAEHLLNSYPTIRRQFVSGMLRA